MSADVLHSIFANAAAHYAKAEFKEAYNTYVRAANAALVALANGIIWEGHDIIEKPAGVGDLLQIAHQSLARAEELIRARSILSGESQPSSSNMMITATPDARLASQTNAPFPEPVPSIPISPVTQQQVKHAFQLQLAERRYAESTRQEHADLGSLRRLLEDVRIQKGKVEDLQALCQKVATVPLQHWPAEEVAKEIATINAELFAKVDVRNEVAREASLLGPNATLCVDFNTYLERIMIHAIVGAKAAPSPEIATDARAVAIAQVISIAHSLFYRYRDVNGFIAALNALGSPEVRRLQKAWDHVPPKATEALKELQDAVGTGSGRDHLELIAQILEYHYLGGGILVAVPYLPPFIRDVEDLHSAYSAGVQGDRGSAMLSEIGARALEDVLSTLTLCQGVGKPDPSLGKASRAAAGARSSGRTAHSSTTVPGDLTQLGPRQFPVSHWLLTRVFWSREELWYQSGESEKLLAGESFPPQYQKMLEEHAAAAARAARCERTLMENRAAQVQNRETPPPAATTPLAADPVLAQLVSPSLPVAFEAVAAPDTLAAPSISGPTMDDGIEDDEDLLAILEALPVIPGSLDDDLSASVSDEKSASLQPSDQDQSDIASNLPSDSAHPHEQAASSATPPQQPTTTDTDAPPERGYDYMDRYLGSLTEPFPGSNMEEPAPPGPPEAHQESGEQQNVNQNVEPVALLETAEPSHEVGPDDGGGGEVSEATVASIAAEVGSDVRESLSGGTEAGSISDALGLRATAGDDIPSVSDGEESGKAGKLLTESEVSGAGAEAEGGASQETGDPELDELQRRFLSLR